MTTIVHTAHSSSFPGEYFVRDAKGETIATLCTTLVGGDYYMRICWVGGSLHGKTEISEGGLDGAMEQIAANHVC